MNKELKDELKNLTAKLYRYDRGEIDMPREDADRIWNRILELDKMAAEQKGAEK